MDTFPLDVSLGGRCWTTDSQALLLFCLVVSKSIFPYLLFLFKSSCRAEERLSVQNSCQTSLRPWVGLHSSCVTIGPAWWPVSALRALEVETKQTECAVRTQSESWVWVKDLASVEDKEQFKKDIGCLHLYRWCYWPDFIVGKLRHSRLKKLDSSYQSRTWESENLNKLVFPSQLLS